MIPGFDPSHSLTKALQERRAQRASVTIRPQPNAMRVLQLASKEMDRRLDVAFEHIRRDLAAEDTVQAYAAAQEKGVGAEFLKGMVAQLQLNIQEQVMRTTEFKTAHTSRLIQTLLHKAHPKFLLQSLDPNLNPAAEQWSVEEFAQAINVHHRAEAIKKERQEDLLAAAPAVRAYLAVVEGASEERAEIREGIEQHWFQQRVPLSQSILLEAYEQAHPDAAQKAERERQRLATELGTSAPRAAAPHP